MSLLKRRIALLALALACLAGLSGMASCSPAPPDRPSGQVSDANVYDRELKLECSVEEPSGPPTSTKVSFTLLDCSTSKTLPPAVPSQTFALDPDYERVFGYSADDAARISDGFHYVYVHLSIQNPSDKALAMDYSLGSVVSGTDELDNSEAGTVSKQPVWYNLGAGKEKTKNYWLGVLGARQSQDVELVYVASDSVLTSGKGPFLLLDSHVEKKAFSLDLGDLGSSS